MDCQNRQPVRMVGSKIYLAEFHFRQVLLAWLNAVRPSINRLRVFCKFLQQYFQFYRLVLREVLRRCHQ